MNLMLRTIKHRYGPNLSPHTQREQPEACAPDDFNKGKEKKPHELIYCTQINSFNLAAISFPQRKRPEGAVEKGEQGRKG